MSPRVSVVIPSFNNAAHIEATVRSVLGQTLEDFELIISDHGSTDGTWEVLQKFSSDPRVTLTQISPGGGAERNWNHVTGMARADLVKLVCADDLLAPHCLESQVAAFEFEGPGVVMVAARRSIVDNEGRVIATARGLAGLSGRVTGHTASRLALRAGTNIFGEPACVMFRRDALSTAQLWDASHGYVIDLATYLNVLALGDLVAQPQPLAAFRVSSGQWSVRLVGEQTRQVAALRRRAADQWPGQYTRLDLVRGAVMNHVEAGRRRLAYRLFAHRM